MMDALEATTCLLGKIRKIDPENASRIMGYLLIEELSEKDLIRVAFGPDTHLHSLVFKAKSHLGLLSPKTSSNYFEFNPTTITTSFGSDTHSSISSSSSSSITSHHHHHHHRRSYSASYVGSPSGGVAVGSPTSFMRAKAAAQARHQQLFVGSPPAASTNYVNFIFQQQHNDAHRARSALMMEEEMPRFRHMRPESSDFMALGLMDRSSAAARQIYLTFPAESTFKDEDVSEYFSNFGPVLDVRIPYQQKRMFGFVTFLYPDTVKAILARGNPHFICDSRVLVKPYKENRKFPEKRYYHHRSDSGDFPACLSPSGIDSRQFYELQPGPEMFSNAQELMLRRQLEEKADLQKSIELQGMRLRNLQLPDLENLPSYRHQHSVSFGCPSPLSSRYGNSSVSLPFDDANQTAIKEDFSKSPAAGYSTTLAVAAEQQQLQEKVDGNGSMQESSILDEFDPQANVEHFLPENLFSSPKKSDGDHLSVFSNSAETEISSTLAAPSFCENTMELNAPSTSLASQ